MKNNTETASCYLAACTNVGQRSLSIGTFQHMGSPPSSSVYSQGERIGGENYYYTRDHLGSVRELTDSNGAIQARYEYDPYGRRTKVTGNLEASIGYTGHYQHIASGLTLTYYRAYDAELGRWISRDPIGDPSMHLMANSLRLPHGTARKLRLSSQVPVEVLEGPNLYSYVKNRPVSRVDPLGLDDFLEGTEFENTFPDVAQTQYTDQGYITEGLMKAAWVPLAIPGTAAMGGICLTEAAGVVAKDPVGFIAGVGDGLSPSPPEPNGSPAYILGNILGNYLSNFLH